MEEHNSCYSAYLSRQRKIIASGNFEHKLSEYLSMDVKGKGCLFEKSLNIALSNHSFRPQSLLFLFHIITVDDVLEAVALVEMLKEVEDTVVEDDTDATSGW